MDSLNSLLQARASGEEAFKRKLLEKIEEKEGKLDEQDVRNHVMLQLFRELIEEVK